MHGKFFWYDVMTTDPVAAKKFYGDVVGWGIEETKQPGVEYTLLTVKGRGVAGLMAIPPEAKGMPPCWMGYIWADDVDAAAAKLEKEGGTIHRPPTDVPGVIRFAVVSDPQGAGFLLAKGMPTETPPPLAGDAPGTVGWRELFAGEWNAAFAFYEKMFGWTKAEAIDMGPMGTYQLFGAGEGQMGGMMTKPDKVPQPCWSFYINVEAIDAAAARVTAGGGKIQNGPMQVPGGQWVVQCLDPQGAYFGLVAPAR